MTLQTIAVPDAPKAIGPYAQGIVAGGFLFTAGQIPLDPATARLVAALLVLNSRAWGALAKRWSLLPEDSAALADGRLQQHLENLCRQSLARFPEYAQVRRCWVALEPWTIDNGLLTPTLKLKRPVIERRFAEHILKLYVGHLSPV